MSVFRVEKNRDFTVMSNYHLRDKNLSNKAKGLLSIMLSLPEEWNYTTEGLSHICKDGYEAIRSQLKELEEHGYITRERTRNSKGQLAGYDYTIHEIPVTNNEPTSENPNTEKPTLENPFVDNPSVEKPSVEKTMQSNTDKSNTNISNTYSINNQSINLDAMDRCEVEEMISEQIDYEFLLNDCDEAQVKEIVTIMSDVLCTPASTIKINGTQIKKSDVLARFSQLEDEHIRYVFTSMEKNIKSIKNIRAYLITALYNAPATIDNYYTALFNSSKNNLNND